jgi:hypothetical protein
MKRLLIGITGLVALAATGCAISGYAIAFLSAVPKEVLHQKISCPLDRQVKATSLHVLGTHRWAQGVVVLHSAVCPDEKRANRMQRVFGHKVVKRDGMNWQISGSGSFNLEQRQKPSPEERLIDYGTSQPAPQRGDRYTILYGQVLSSKVSAVEATFDNGQIIRDYSTNGVFALVAPNATAVCQLRVLGSDNQILRQSDLAIPKQLARGKKTHQCLPVSRQL